MSELDGKVVLVTGASRGLGYQAALEAARRGAHVIAIARNRRRGFRLLAIKRLGVDRLHAG